MYVKTEESERLYLLEDTKSRMVKYRSILIAQILRPSFLTSDYKYKRIQLFFSRKLV